MGKLELQYWTADGWDTLWSRSGQRQDSTSSAWLRAQVVVPLLAGVLRFVGTTGSFERSDIAVDNVAAATLSPPLSFWHHKFIRTGVFRRFLSDLASNLTWSAESTWYAEV